MLLLTLSALAAVTVLVVVMATGYWVWSTGLGTMQCGWRRAEMDGPGRLQLRRLCHHQTGLGGRASLESEHSYVCLGMCADGETPLPRATP
jgi:hypothetical protein